MTLAHALIAAAALWQAPAGFADLDLLDARVARFTGAATGTPGGAVQPLDRRLRLKPCAADPLLGWLGQRRETVVVQCPDPGGWRLFVPVGGAALAAMPGLVQPPAIGRGDAVTIAVAGAGFSVSQPGEAMEAGAIGAWIRVRPLRQGQGSASAEPMRAQVERPGLVRVPLP